MNRDFVEMLAALCEAEAEFMVVGAHAVAAYSRPRATGDLDLWVRAVPANAARVWKALVAFGAPLEDLTQTDLAADDLIYQVGVVPTRIELHQRAICKLVHAQMQPHFWEEAGGYDVVVRPSFDGLRPSAYTSSEPPLDFRHRPPDLTRIASYRFGGFERCLYSEQKFASDTERQVAMILDRESEKWFKPAKGQFQIYYRWGAAQPEYQPDFVGEMDDAIYMLEPKAANEMTAPEVLAKKAAAVTWCEHATVHAQSHGGKPWRYALIPHDAIADNMTVEGLMRRFGA
jgi:hypothetical protein